MKLKLEKPGLVEFDPKFAPPNVDPKSISRLIRNYEATMKNQMNDDFAASQREVDLMDSLNDPGLFTFDQKKATALGEKARKETELLTGEEPPQSETIIGHNPNLFPPFFMSFRSSTSSGVFTTPRQVFNGAAGLLGMSVAAFPPGGHIDRSMFMGAFTTAPSTELATVSVSTFVGATIAAITLLGYGRASARLLVSVLADGPSGFRAATGVNLLDDRVMGVNRIPLTNMTATTRLMVNAGDVLLISCGLRVVAGCGGLVCSAASNVTLSGTVLCLF